MEKTLSLLKNALQENNAPVELRRAVIKLMADGILQSALVESLTNMYETETDTARQQCLMDTLAYVRSLELVLN